MKPSLRAFFTNLGGPMPARQKIARLLANNWTKIRLRSDCCGNNGQPGC
jgi:hypothetical protein